MKIINDAGGVVASSSRSGTSGAMSRYRNEHDVPSGRDVDHKLDLQLGGRKDMDNLWSLDSSVNRSLGAQIHHKIKVLPAGTIMDNFLIKDR